MSVEDKIRLATGILAVGDVVGFIMLMVMIGSYLVDLRRWWSVAPEWPGR